MKLGAIAVAAILVGACSSGSPDEGSGAVTAADRTTPRADGGTSVDGTPTRVPCTSDFGSGLAGTFGRLDGTIVSVVPNGHTGACNADRSHVHLQVLSKGAVYDVAVNTDGGFIAEKDMPLPGGAWSDGWHRGGSLDYVQDLGLHVADFQSQNEPALEQQLLDAVANANHVSVFATLYNRGGIHLVHRRANDQDGALILDPLSPKARVLVFHFSDQTF